MQTFQYNRVKSRHEGHQTRDSGLELQVHDASRGLWRSKCTKIKNTYVKHIEHHALHAVLYYAAQNKNTYFKFIEHHILIYIHLDMKKNIFKPCARREIMFSRAQRLKMPAWNRKVAGRITCSLHNQSPKGCRTNAGSTTKLYMYQAINKDLKFDV